MKECDLDVYKQAIIVGKFVDIKKRSVHFSLTFIYLLTQKS